MPEAKPKFIGGLELSRRFYRETVRPLLERHFPELLHAAALLGTGSEVLGFDTEMSTDHDWGPSALLFLREADVHLAGTISEVMAEYLPRRFYGYPTHSAYAPGEPDTLVMAEQDDGPIRHHVFVTTVRRFVLRHLNFDIDAPLHVADWLSFHPNGCWALPVAQFTMTARARLRRYVKGSPTTRTTSGSTCSPQAGGASARRSRSWAGGVGRGRTWLSHHRFAARPRRDEPGVFARAALRTPRQVVRHGL